METLETTIDGVRYFVHHNTDWSGEAIITRVDAGAGLAGVMELVVKLPGELLRACGRDRAFRDVIAAVEQMA
jgi:hypothetical protein